MNKSLVSTKVLALALCSIGISTSDLHAKIQITEIERMQLIERGRVWSPPPALTPEQVMRGPQPPKGKRAFEFNERVDCVFDAKATIERARESAGKTPKLDCKLVGADGSVAKKPIKIKYGANNGEVFAEILFTRTMWALGFYADRVYPVRLRCIGCPNEDPWKWAKKRVRGSGDFEITEPTDTLFVNALVEYKYPAEKVEGGKHLSGFTLKELNEVRESAGGSSPIDTDALKIAAAFVGHGDRKPDNQGMACEPKSADSIEECEESILYIHDGGATFGDTVTMRAFIRGTTEASKADFRKWSAKRLWLENRECHLDFLPARQARQAGDEANPKVTPQAQHALYALFKQQFPTEQHVEALFTAARIEDRVSRRETFTVDDWTKAFMRRVERQLGGEDCSNR